jgi:hypothetical protein
VKLARWRTGEPVNESFLIDRELQGLVRQFTGAPVPRLAAKETSSC